VILQMDWVRNRPVFGDAILPERRARWDLFGATFGAQCIVVAVLVILPMLMPEQMEVVRRYWVTPIQAPPILAWKPKPVPPALTPVVKRVVVKEVPKPAEAIAPPQPKIYNPVITSPIAKRATAHKKVSAPDMNEVAKAFSDPAPMSMGSSAIPTLKKPRAAVQTGGFGDPDGLPSTQKITRAVNVASLGSYALPPGPGYGNGTGGAKGARGVIASAGFGNGVAIGGTGGGNHGAAQQAGFTDQEAVAPAPKVKQASAEAHTQPVEILYKPRPVYTSQAIAKKIEGEVLLDVVFSASGDVRVERLVQGLGYGLNESAQAAARQIRFRPAMQNGQPVDSSAIVHIVFELAY
jgi:periplasmic protein TonB